jgi:hypothetical protein
VQPGFGAARLGGERHVGVGERGLGTCQLQLCRREIDQRRDAARNRFERRQEMLLGRFEPAVVKALQPFHEAGPGQLEAAIG